MRAIPSPLQTGAGPGRHAFTLVELMIVVGVVALLVAILLPAFVNARRQARALQCQANLRVLAQGVMIYVTENRGKYPPDDPVNKAYWHDEFRVGGLLSPGGLRKGGVFSCPTEPEARLSYAINVWTCSKILADVAEVSPPAGVRWGSHIPNGAQVILLVETWSGFSPESKGYAPNYSSVGWRGDAPGRRFGAGGGLSPLLDAGRFGIANTEIVYSRHRPAGVRGAVTLPAGVTHIAYADGHVQPKRHDELADFDTGKSRLDSLWSPLDAVQNR